MRLRDDGVLALAADFAGAALVADLVADLAVDLPAAFLAATGDLRAGFFGVGGGFLIVPFLNQLNSVSMRNAVATSLVIIATISSSGFLAHLVTQTVNWHQLAWLCIGGITGMVLGSVLARWIAGVYLQRIFAATIMVMTCLLIIR